ncbi:hypothetical protein [Paractinoplanes hotanensis]|nr:hypothetical protein [Actinoplanes hotanensis]
MNPEVAEGGNAASAVPAASTPEMDTANRVIDRGEESMSAFLPV